MATHEMEDNIAPENEVLKWLRRIGLEDFYDNFKNEGFDDLETVAFTFRADTPETRELLLKLNINKLGNQQKIIRKAQQIVGSQSPNLNGEPRSKNSFLQAKILLYACNLILLAKAEFIVIFPVAISISEI